MGMTSVAENRTAIGFLSAAQKVVVSDYEPWHRNGTSGVEVNNEDPEYTKVLPNGPFAITSPQSSTVYVYYQANATAIGEITQDVSRNLWSKDAPVYLFITWFWLYLIFLGGHDRFSSNKITLGEIYALDRKSLCILIYLYVHDAHLNWALLSSYIDFWPPEGQLICHLFS